MKNYITSNLANKEKYGLIRMTLMIKPRDPEGALDVAGDSASQLTEAALEQPDSGEFPSC